MLTRLNNIQMHLSPLIPGNTNEVKRLFHETFADSESESEGKLIGDLVHEILTTTPKQDYCGFFAHKNEHLVGCILFSRLRFEFDTTVFLLSPVAISTKYQRQGVGQQLITFGLNQLKENGVELVVTYGDPNYYCKVGFSMISEEVVSAPLKLSFPDGWQALSLCRDVIEPIAGQSYCIDAFNKPEIW